MKSSEKDNLQEEETKMTSHSETEQSAAVSVPSKFQTTIQLKPYEYDPKDLEAFVKKYEQIDPVTDMKSAKKARAELKKKIAEIKKVHLNNKKVILQFKRDVEEYDFQKFETLTADITNLYKKFDLAIEKIENAASIRENEISEKIANLTNQLMNDIMNATDMNEIQQVQAKIAQYVPDPNEFDKRVGEVSSMLTSMTLKAGGRSNEIMNAGGKISAQAVQPIQMDTMSSGQSRRYTDTELLNLIQGSSAQKGWMVNINPNTGVQIYQIDDPKAPKDIRVALEEAFVKHKGI